MRGHCFGSLGFVFLLSSIAGNVAYGYGYKAGNSLKLQD